MILDFLLVGGMSNILKLHHCACLLGHFLVITKVNSLAFNIYFRGVAVLEIGSGCMNLFLIGHNTSWNMSAVCVYVVGMTGSNLVALYVLRHWLRSPIPVMAKGITTLLTTCILTLRQSSLIDNVQRYPL